MIYYNILEYSIVHDNIVIYENILYNPHSTPILPL